MPPNPLDRRATVFVAGHRGLVGSAIWRFLESEGFEHLVGVSSRDVDLGDAEATRSFFEREKPDVVIDAAARVGGIVANSSSPADFLVDNLKIQVNLMEAAQRGAVQKFLFLGSSCIYPKFAPQPISEDSLLTGPLEETNIAYAIAKISGVVGVQSYRRQHGLSWISAMPTNLYGPNDNFDPTTSHVLPALVRRFDDAVRLGQKEVVLWGTGKPRREFLHVDDLARACLMLLENYDDDRPINVGTGKDISIRALAELIADVIGYDGSIVQDPTKPDGTPRKLLDVSRLESLGWAPNIDLRTGIEMTVKWYQETKRSKSDTGW